MRSRAASMMGKYYLQRKLLETTVALSGESSKEEYYS